MVEWYMKRESSGTSKRHVILTERRTILLQGSQAPPASPDKGSVNVKTL
jgi:hypothetical protein